MMYFDDRKINQIYWNMRSYYINNQHQKEGVHEVHTAECPFLPNSMNRRYIGAFKSVDMALENASNVYASVEGCKYCCEKHQK